MSSSSSPLLSVYSKIKFQNLPVNLKREYSLGARREYSSGRKDSKVSRTPDNLWIYCLCTLVGIGCLAWNRRSTDCVPEEGRKLNSSSDRDTSKPGHRSKFKFRADERIYKNDPVFTTRLAFHKETVFVHNEIMIGTMRPEGSIGAPPHLVAFNMKTEKMVWCIPLVRGNPLTPKTPGDLSLDSSQPPFNKFPGMKAEYCLNRVGDDIIFQFIGEKKVHFIKPDTGEINSVLTLPHIHNDKFDHIHLTPDGFGYQMIVRFLFRRTLVGGKIIDSKLNSSFTVKTPTGYFLPLSTHVGFLHDLEKKLVVFGPSGAQVTIENCLSAQGIGDKLYLIEKDPNQKNKCSLTIRTMTDNEKGVSDVEKRIVLNAKEADFGSLCDNGQLILFERKGVQISPIFVDLSKEEVVYSRHKAPCYAKQVINTASGEIWSWDQISKKIWKISSDEITLMGLLESDRGTNLLYVDRNDHLYFNVKYF